MKPTLPALFALAALLAGCAGAPTRIHTLDALGAAGATPAAYAGSGFRVDAVHIPPAYDRPELIRRTQAYTLTLSDTDRWAAPLGELIRRTLTQDLSARLPPGAVIFPDAPKPAFARGLVIDILSITPTASGVDMEASWTWLSPRSMAAGTKQTANAADVRIAAPLSVRLSTPAVGSGPAAIAPEISALLALLADRIAAQAL